MSKPNEVLNAVVPKKLRSLEIMVASVKEDIPSDLLHRVRGSTEPVAHDGAAVIEKLMDCATNRRIANRALAVGARRM
jgi:hypothetical protein